MEEILKEVKYGNPVVAEQELRRLREKFMDDPKVSAYELKRLDQAIDAVRDMKR